LGSRERLVSSGDEHEYLLTTLTKIGSIHIFTKSDKLPLLRCYSRGHLYWRQQPGFSLTNTLHRKHGYFISKSDASFHVFLTTCLKVQCNCSYSDCTVALVKEREKKGKEEVGNKYQNLISNLITIWLVF
jgi:hypothetical protein